MIQTRCSYTIGVGALMLSACIPPALAQTYPTKTIRLIVGYAAGGPNDIHQSPFDKFAHECFDMTGESQIEKLGEAVALVVRKLAPRFPRSHEVSAIEDRCRNGSG